MENSLEVGIAINPGAGHLLSAYYVIFNCERQ